MRITLGVYETRWQGGEALPTASEVTVSITQAVQVPEHLRHCAWLLSLRLNPLEEFLHCFYFILLIGILLQFYWGKNECAWWENV